MNSAAAKTARRVLAALETLTDEESGLLGRGDLARLIEVQTRMAPLVDLLSEMGPDVADEAMRQAVLRLLNRRLENGSRLNRELERMRGARREWQRVRARLERMKPAFTGIPAKPVLFARA
ncbi:MAG TPA: hypothetical protein VHE13_06060 [Opitutus sp.]|nr:hypothetical protein [Opitutus sp.]